MDIISSNRRTFCKYRTYIIILLSFSLNRSPILMYFQITSDEIGPTSSPTNSPTTQSPTTAEPTVSPATGSPETVSPTCPTTVPTQSPTVPSTLIVYANFEGSPPDGDAKSQIRQELKQKYRNSYGVESKDLVKFSP